MPRSKQHSSDKKNLRAGSSAGAIQERGADRSATVAVESTVPYLPIPRDDDWRFAHSFAHVGEENAARAFFDAYGFAVFHDVLTLDETAATRDEMLSHVERVTAGFVAHDESTWDRWRLSGSSFGMPGADPSAWWQPQLSRNRCHPCVAAGFAQLLGCRPETLRCSHDRWALYVRGLKTRKNVHLDINPWLYANGAAAVAARRAEYAYASHDELFGGHDNLVSAAHGPHLQGTLALLANETDDAGFICVPGSHHAFGEWVGTLRAETAAGGARYDFPDHSHYHSMAQRVPVREGSLIVWDARLVHGSSPDQSPQGRETNPRFVQFVSLRTESLLADEQADRRAALVQRLFAAHGVEEPVDPVQRAVAGLERPVAAQVGGGRITAPGEEVVVEQ